MSFQWNKLLPQKIFTVIYQTKFLLNILKNSQQLCGIIVNNSSRIVQSYIIVVKTFYVKPSYKNTLLVWQIFWIVQAFFIDGAKHLSTTRLTLNFFNQFESCSLISFNLTKHPTNFYRTKKFFRRLAFYVDFWPVFVSSQPSFSYEHSPPSSLKACYHPSISTHPTQASPPSSFKACYHPSISTPPSLKACYHPSISTSPSLKACYHPSISTRPTQASPPCPYTTLGCKQPRLQSATVTKDILFFMFLNSPS